MEKNKWSKGCNNCKHYKIGELKMWEADVPRKCLKGNDLIFNFWWEKNGHKTEEELTDMPCYEETVLGVLVIELGNILDEMRKSVEKREILEELRKATND